MTPLSPAGFRAAGAAALVALGLVAGCQPAAGGPATPPPDAVVVSASASRFDQTSVQAPAGQAFTLWFDNREPVPHNVRVVDSAGTSVGATEVFNGPAGRPLAVDSLAAGTYTLLCDVHPDMRASLIAD